MFLFVPTKINIIFVTDFVRACLSSQNFYSLYKNIIVQKKKLTETQKVWRRSSSTKKDLTTTTLEVNILRR